MFNKIKIDGHVFAQAEKKDFEAWAKEIRARGYGSIMSGDGMALHVSAHQPTPQTGFFLAEPANPGRLYLFKVFERVPGDILFARVERVIDIHYTLDF